MRQLLLDFTRAPAPTFENFVHGRNAELVHALEAAAREGFADRVIYIWGETAAGKTHLLRAFAKASGAGYRQGRDFDGFDRSGAVVALDAIEGLSAGAQADIFNAFNERAFGLLVVAAQSAPRDVAIRRDLATRLATGLTYRVLALTDEEKRAALAAHAKTRGFALDEGVSAYLLSRLRRDMGSLIAALDSLDRYSLETGRPITLPLLKAALQPDLLAGPPT
jgi:DnaA family protein